MTRVGLSCVGLPLMIKQVSETAGQAFLPLVLLVAGMSLMGSVGYLTSLRHAILPAILVVLKSVILPLLISVVHRTIRCACM